MMSFSYTGKRLSHFSWRIYSAISLLILVFLLARLPALLSIPLFNDESMHIYRAQGLPETLQLTLHTGKLLHVVLLAPIVRLPFDPLITGRLLSVACGLGTVLVLLLLGYKLMQPLAGWMAAILYIGAPGAMLHDRLALADSTMTLVGCFVLLASISFAHTLQPTHRQAALIGMLIGIATLVKLSGLFLFIFPALAAFCLVNTKLDRRRHLELLLFAVIVFSSFIVVLVLLQYGAFEKRTSVSLTDQLANIAENNQILIQCLINYLPAPLLILPLLALVYRHIVPSTHQQIIFLLLGGLAFSFVFVITGRELMSRYFLPAWPPLFLACALGTLTLWRIPRPARLLRRTLIIIILGGVLIWDGYTVIQLQRDPPNAPMIAFDRKQYIETWTAGYQVPALVAAVMQEANSDREIVLLQHVQILRLIHVGPFIYLNKHPHIEVDTIDVRESHAPSQVEQYSSHRPVYLLLDEDEVVSYNIDERFPMLRVRQFFENPISGYRFYLYERR